MVRYVVKRLLIMIPTLLAVGIIMFTLMNFVPGDPAQLALGSGVHSEAEIEAKRVALGLDRPFVVRLGEYVTKVFTRFDFGKSLIDGTEIKWELMKRFPHTAKIAIFSIILTVVVGLPLGIYTAVHANSLGDRVSLLVTLLFDCMPSFWTALILVLLFSLKLKLLPSSGAKSLVYFILPTIANSLGGLAGFTRQVRASMLEVVKSDYVTTARSKGLSERDVIYGHALPNALIPILTVIGMRFGSMLGGATIIEVVFSIPGIGQYLVNSINNRDYNACTGGIIFIAFTFALIMLLTDLLYAFADPRIKAQYVSSSKKKVK
ncbi:ABC transporter permease [Blautia glucerasea]|uniref:ABC transporter permease n=1 Tax=Blautia glucerasea TaxID=536633 RepID=UPI001D01C01A|nr:ABC transporter permease [Blautia glucerasea]MCB5388031.1 ABC transporter permease [Blautia glucerasea]MCB5422395.1 ABC transporter permease [Blautia luti]